MSPYRAAIAIASAVIFVSTIFWPSIESRFGVVATPSPSPTPTDEARDVPAIVLIYKTADKKFYLYNTGGANLQLWGTRLDAGPSSIGTEPNYIPLNAYFWLPGDSFSHEVLSKLPDGTTANVRFDAFLKNSLGEKYIATFALAVHVKNHIVSVDSRLVALDRKNWPDTSLAPNIVVTGTPNSTAPSSARTPPPSSHQASPGKLVVKASSNGKPVAGATVAIVGEANGAAAPETKTDESGIAALSVGAHQEYAVLVAHADYGGTVTRNVDPALSMIEVPLDKRENVGSVIIAHRVGYIPGLPANRLNPIEDQSKRRYVYVDGMSAIGQPGQPYAIELNRQLTLEDHTGPRVHIRFMFLRGETSLVNYSWAGTVMPINYLSRAQQLASTFDRPDTLKQEVRDWTYAVREALKQHYGSESYEIFNDISKEQIAKIVGIVQRLEMYCGKNNVLGDESGWDTTRRMRSLLDDLDRAAESPLVPEGARPGLTRGD